MLQLFILTKLLTTLDEEEKTEVTNFSSELHQNDDNTRESYPD